MPQGMSLRDPEFKAGCIRLILTDEKLLFRGIKRPCQLSIRTPEVPFLPSLPAEVHPQPIQLIAEPVHLEREPVQRISFSGCPLSL
jgi:hypothetical protein